MLPTQVIDSAKHAEITLNLKLTKTVSTRFIIQTPTPQLTAISKIFGIIPLTKRLRQHFENPLHSR